MHLRSFAPCEFLSIIVILLLMKIIIKPMLKLWSFAFPVRMSLFSN